RLPLHRLRRLRQRKRVGTRSASPRAVAVRRSRYARTWVTYRAHRYEKRPGIPSLSFGVYRNNSRASGDILLAPSFSWGNENGEWSSAVGTTNLPCLRHSCIVQLFPPAESRGLPEYRR